jgi:hypothetical protein
MKRIVKAIARFLRIWFGSQNCFICGRSLPNGGTICPECRRAFCERSDIGSGGPWTGGR